MADNDDKELYRALGGLEASVERIGDQLGQLVKQIGQLETRMRKMEMRGAAFGAMAGAVFAVAVTYVKSLIAGSPS